MSVIGKRGRKVTRSRFVRLVRAESRAYAERFAQTVCRGFKPEKAEYRTGTFKGRKAAVMLFKKRGWLFAEQRHAQPEAVASVQA